MGSSFKREVILKSITTVVPATPTSSTKRYFLSNLDQVFAGQWYMNTAWYFKPAVLAEEHSVIFSSLKDSLSRVLVHYPILAGRVTKSEDGRFEVDLNDAGLIFREAVTNARFEDWEDIKDCTIEEKLNPEDTVIQDYSVSPLIRIQVTIFACGGIALGFSMAHGTEDGWAAIEFIKSWSEVHQGLEISTPPVFASHLMKAREPPLVSVPVKDYVSLPKSGCLSSNYEIFEEGAPSPYQSIMFRFSGEEVDGIINEVENGPWKIPKVSSFIAMAAFTWKVITEARELPDEQVTRYVYPISCRKRWEPNLPDGYFGNSAHISSLPAKAGDIKKNHVSYAAKLIFDDIGNTDTEYLKSVIDWIGIELGKDRDIGFACDYYGGTDVQSTSMVNFPIFEVDFGWGNPIHNSFTFQPILGDGHAYMFPSPDGGRSRLVPIYMKRSAMKNLFSVELFRRFQTHLEDYDYYPK